MKRRAFYCAAQEQYVFCAAPMQCFDNCKEYRAEHITGVKNRIFNCKEDNAVITLKTGFIRGNCLIAI